MAAIGTTVVVACVSLLAAGASGQLCTDSFYCDADYCTSECKPLCMLNPPDPDGDCDGVIMQLYLDEDDFCNCCPGTCIPYLKEGESCEPVITDPTDGMCGPRLSCDSNFPSTCVRGQTPCLQELTDYESGVQGGSVGMNQSPPVCDEDGFYSPVQCSRGGLCRCVEKETGAPIFGSTGSISETVGSEQNCECARHYYEALVQGCKMSITFHGSIEQFQEDLDDCIRKSTSSNFLDHDYFPGYMRCMPNGNFDTIQCVTSYLEEDWCFCMFDNFNVTSGLVFQSTTSDLPCYDKDIHFPAYFRPCEAEHAELRRLTAEYASDDGRFFFPGSTGPKCSVDGWYDKVQQSRENYTQLYCSDAEGERIEDFSATLFEEDGDAMACECAWTRRYLADGVTKPMCCENGNFKGYQCQGGFCYCVDEYGRQSEQEVDQLEVGDLSCKDHCLP